jgi:hypothetical protein
LSGRTPAPKKSAGPGGGRKYELFPPADRLPLTTYFSGPKIKWIIDHAPGVKAALAKGEAIFGNIDTWLLWWLTGGPDGGVHVTDVTNASRTMLMNIETLDWDPEMLRVMGIPREMLPEIRSSSEVYGHTAKTVFSAEKSRFPAFLAINRPRFSARPAFRRVKPRTHTAPDVSCCSTPVKKPFSQNTAC